MKFKETKYNIGDKFYRLYDNSIREYTVSCVNAKIGPNVNDERHLYELSYLGNRCTSHFTESELEKCFFASRRDLMLSMFPDEFEDGLIVKQK